MLEKINDLIREKGGDEFYREMIENFMTTAKNPHFDVLYSDLVYQPMKELLSYLRASGFNVYIITSGDITFVKRVANRLYASSPDRVFDFDTFKASVRKKPVIAAGSLDGGEYMEILAYSQKSELPSLQMLIEHDDKEREFAYGRDESLQASGINDWLPISMENDWKSIFPVTLTEELQEKEALPAVSESEASESDVAVENKLSGPQIGITRPLPEKGPTNVYTTLFIIDVDEVNTVMQSFAANIYTRYAWWDPRLAHGGKGTVTYNLTDIWTPRLIVLNRQRLWKSFPRVAEVDSTGEVTYDQRSWGYFSQPLDLRDFPFDEQTLNFSFLAPNYTPQEVKLLMSETDGFGMAKNFSVPDWDVIGWDYPTESYLPTEDEELSMITYSLKLKRHIEHYIYKIVIPLVFIVVMSWTVFWIDPKLVGTNVAAATTCFLTLVAYRFAISSYLPEIPYFTRLDALVFWSTILVFSSLIQTILLSYFVSKKKDILARKVEIIARFVYPASFVVIIFFTLIK